MKAYKHFLPHCL